ncbi:rCG64461, partial [Rattus norvegicus]
IRIQHSHFWKGHGASSLS